MGLQDILMPGEKRLSERKPFYATSRRIMRFNEREKGEPAEIAYQQLSRHGSFAIVALEGNGSRRIWHIITVLEQ